MSEAPAPLETDDKAAAYADLEARLRSVIAGETSSVARFATAACMIAQTFGPRFFWTGFYLVDPDKPDELVIGPYQGSLGCLRIAFGKGVCGTAAERGESVLVEDVHAFPGHIACDIRSRSEIVVPVFDGEGVLRGVLDVDSEQRGAFDETDRAGLEAVCAALLTAP